MATRDLRHAQAAQQRLLDAVGRDGRVAAVGITPVADGYELNVNVLESETEDWVPREVDGIAVNVRRVKRTRRR